MPGLMIGYFLPTEVGSIIALPEGTAVEDLHLTILYLGKELDDDQVKIVEEVTADLAEETASLEGEIGGWGRFPFNSNTEFRDVLVRLVDVPRLEALREELIKRLRRRGVEYDATHGFTPHITVNYVQPDERIPSTKVTPVTFKLDTLTVANKEVHKDYKLKGTRVFKSQGIVQRVVSTSKSRNWIEVVSDDAQFGFYVSSKNASVRTGDYVTWNETKCTWTPMSAGPRPMTGVLEPGEVSKDIDKFSFSTDPYATRPVLTEFALDVLGGPLPPQGPPIQEVSFKTDIKKIDEDQRLAFGWAMITEINDKFLIDRQGDIVREEELEKAAYLFVLNARKGGLMHRRAGKDGEKPLQVGRLVESIVFTKEKQNTLGVDLGVIGWWIGFFVDDDKTWEKVKAGELPAFSIHGPAKRTVLMER